LPGVCLFEGEDELNFIIFNDEGFRGKNSDIISKFIEKYPQIDLDIKEKQKIINYIYNNNKGSKLYYKNLYCSMIMLISFLSKNKKMKEDEAIYLIIKNNLGSLKLSHDLKNFFSNEGKNLTLNKMLNLFFFIEHLYFKDLSNNLQQEYKAQIPEEIKNKIIEKLLKKNNSNDKIIIKELAAATRRFISRYLVGTREDIEIKENRELSFELSREELWEEKKRKSNDLIDIIYEKIDEFKLNVGQAYEFYNLIGEEDRNEIKHL